MLGSTLQRAAPSALELPSGVTKEEIEAQTGSSEGQPQNPNPDLGSRAPPCAVCRHTQPLVRESIRTSDHPY